jgi:hypothetical protein
MIGQQMIAFGFSIFLVLIYTHRFLGTTGLARGSAAFDFFASRSFLA